MADSLFFIVINWMMALAPAGLLLLLLCSSVAEKAWRAAVIAGGALLFHAGFWYVLLAGVWSSRPGWLFPMLAAVFLLAGIVSWWPYFPPAAPRELKNIQPYDERDHMFSRNHLQRHPDLAARYYAGKPELQLADQAIQAKPDLGHPSQACYDPLLSPFYQAMFAYLDQCRMRPLGRPLGRPVSLEPAEITRRLRGMARYLGAADAGACRVEPYHLYTRHGRHADGWGEPVNNAHRFALVIVAPMDPSRIRHAPAIPGILESSRLYVETAKIAFILAEFIKQLGYDAKAHTDGNYDVLCVPLAVDAGLGQPGRMGILMHPVHGPCVRLSAVTTGLELEPARPVNFHGHEFCQICRKCADNCPTRSIPGGEEPVSRGFRHWSIVQETCYAYWKYLGTDCGLCIRVCPYTKPDTLLHRLARRYIGRNPVNQRIALWCDDLLYGRRVRVRTDNPPDLPA